MFERLGERLDDVLGRFKERGVLTEDMLDEGLREVRRALLEADVNYEVVREFLGRVEERAKGQDVLDSVSPGEQVVKIVHDELTELLGEGAPELAEAPVPPTVVMLVGLQGSGKTTTAAKLARRHKDRGGRPRLVAADPYRPAAADQLETLADRIGVPVHRGEVESAGTGDRRRKGDVVRLAEEAVDEARRDGANLVLLDMAGRLQIDDELMEELSAVREAVEPQEVLLVADAMTGQEAVRIAEGFHEAVGLSGVVLTKMDGDARGGAALSIYSVLGVPVKFVGTGERPEDLTAFDPERMAGRILQMGDVVGLVEKAEQAMDEDAARRMEEKLREGKGFDLEDFLQALQQIQRMGPLENILKMMPGVKSEMLDQADLDPKRVKHMEAIVRSMTPEERQNPRVLNGSRRARIARGSGRPVHEVNRLVKQFGQMQKMMKRMGPLGSLMGGSGGGGLGKMRQLLK